MKTLPVLGLATVLCAFVPGTSSAQIISTMVPMENAGPAAAGQNVAFHVMGGYTNWKFGFIDDLKSQEAAAGGTVTGGRNGFIGAADVVFGASDGVSFGIGGWYNKVQDLKITEKGFSDAQTISVSSVYGNIFLKNIGVQAGVIPFKSSDTAVGNSTLTNDDGQTDMDIFLVGRFADAVRRARRLSGAVGAGVYRFGSANRGATNPAFQSPSAMSFTGFANVSLPLVSHVSLDASFWYTAKDKNYNATSGVGNPSQSRITVGIGLQN